MNKRKIALPPIGMRIIKSSIGVLLGFIIYFLRGKHGTPFYTALSVLWCMQPYSSNAKANAIQRTIGTFIGAAYGLIMILVELYVIPFDNELFRYITISLLIIPIIYTTVIFNKKNASYFSCVVFLSIVVNHLKDKNPYLFVFNRMMDTMIGIGLALIINTFELPRKRRNDLLFVAELDKVLLNMKETLTSYSKIELNKMLDDGVKLTIATMKTPGALVTSLQDIRLNLPVIAMDGAILFDMKENKYLKDDNNLAINIRQETIDQLLDKFLSNATESTKKLVEKKISTIEEEISKLEADNSSLDELLINREAEKNKIKHKIYLLEKELLVSHDELTRVELMDKLVSIEVHSKKVLVPVWKM